MTTTPSTAGSATGIDLSDLENTAKEALRDLSHIEMHLEQSKAPKTVLNRAVDVRLCIKELSDALARATPQHPDLDAAQLEPLLQNWFGLEDCKGLFNPARLLAFANAARRATPQHSVTEQAIAEAVEPHMKRCDEMRDALHECKRQLEDSRAQPLASTAATQPEQAAKGELLTEDQRRAVINAVGAAWPTWFENTPLKVLNKLAWNIEQACVAALAIPASTAPTQPELALLNADELAALRRFDECAQDGEGWDVPKLMMQRLAEIGVVRRKSGNFYESTDFGQHVLAQPLSMQPGEKS